MDTDKTSKNMIMQSTENSQIISVVKINNNGEDASFFEKEEVPLQGSPARMLSEQIDAVNFRLRTSDDSYASNWHVAGDPTLLIILNGGMRIELRNGESREFSAGDMFIAADYLNSNVTFDDDIHGHRADVIGKETFSAIHLKLEHLKLEKHLK